MGCVSGLEIGAARCCKFPRIRIASDYLFPDLVTFGKTSHSEGVALSKSATELSTGATINGRLLAQTAGSLSSRTVTHP